MEKPVLYYRGNNSTLDDEPSLTARLSAESRVLYSSSCTVHEEPGRKPSVTEQSTAKPHRPRAKYHQADFEERHHHLMPAPSVSRPHRYLNPVGAQPSAEPSGTAGYHTSRISTIAWPWRSRCRQSATAAPKFSMPKAKSNPSYCVRR